MPESFVQTFTSFKDKLANSFSDEQNATLVHTRKLLGLSALGKDFTFEIERQIGSCWHGLYLCIYPQKWSDAYPPFSARTIFSEQSPQIDRISKVAKNMVWTREEIFSWRNILR